MNDHSTRRQQLSGIAGGLIAAALILLPLSPATATGIQATQDEPGLDQTIDPNQAQGTGRVVLDDGHIDFGPTLGTGEWIVQIHDDTSAPSYWRMPSDVVAQVNDASKLTIPDDELYGFLGLVPGTEAWVIPQVREPGVIWTGWNTQEPHVLEALQLGTTLTIHGVEGPGAVSVYLQSGNFGEPEPLWTTHEPFPQQTWIELNTHTHANWVFAEPGVYLVDIEFSGDLADGTPVSARDTLRFSVGDATDPQQAFAAIAADELPDDAAETVEPGDEEESTAPVAPESESDSVGLLLGWVAAAIGLVLIAAVVVVVVARTRARNRARAQAWQRAETRAQASEEPQSAPEPGSRPETGSEGGTA